MLVVNFWMSPCCEIYKRMKRQSQSADFWSPGLLSEVLVPLPCSTWMLWGLETRHIFSWVPFRFYQLTFQKLLQPCKFRECLYIKEVGSYQFSNANIWRYFYVVDILQQESSVIESKRQSLKRLGFDLLEGTFKRVSSRFVNGATHKALTLPN